MKANIINIFDLFPQLEVPYRLLWASKVTHAHIQPYIMLSLKHSNRLDIRRMLLDNGFMVLPDTFRILDQNGDAMFNYIPGCIPIIVEVHEMFVLNKYPDCEQIAYGKPPLENYGRTLPSISWDLPQKLALHHYLHSYSLEFPENYFISLIARHLALIYHKDMVETEHVEEAIRYRSLLYRSTVEVDAYNYTKLIKLINELDPSMHKSIYNLLIRKYVDQDAYS